MQTVGAEFSNLKPRDYQGMNQEIKASFTWP